MKFDIAKINKFSQVKVLCVGDIMLDAFIKGQMLRISPEAPIPILKKTTSNKMLGGVGNVATNIHSIEANVSLVTVTGNDETALAIKNLCDNFGFHEVEIIIDPKRKTTKKSRFIASQQQVLRVDEEDIHDISAEIVQRIVSKVTAILPNYDILLISDYGKGVCTPQLLQQCIAAAKQHKIPVIIDPKNNDYSVYAGADVVTPNLKELIKAVGKELATEEQIVSFARALCAAHDIKNLVITRASEGMSVVCQKMFSHIPTKAKEICDVSGAGDTVISTIAVCLAAGFDLYEAAEISNAAAGIVVSKFGTATVSKEELLQALRESRIHMWQAKISSRELASETVKNWRAKGLKVGFTNGCFDLLHPGHIKIIHEARAQCDKLVLGLNSDNSIKRLKGPERPVQSEEARATVLASLHDIDAIVLFEEDTPYELIKSLMPDVLVKGADYTESQVVGGDIVKLNGGRVHLVDLVPDNSTTSMIKRAGNNYG